MVSSVLRLFALQHSPVFVNCLTVLLPPLQRLASRGLLKRWNMFLDGSLQCKIGERGEMSTKGIPGCNGHVSIGYSYAAPLGFSPLCWVPLSAGGEKHNHSSLSQLSCFDCSCLMIKLSVGVCICWTKLKCSALSRLQIWYDFQIIGRCWQAKLEDILSMELSLLC